MLSNVQRAEVESKSQQQLVVDRKRIGCYQMYKELKLKANHNISHSVCRIKFVVIKCTKSWSWKQITTQRLRSLIFLPLLSNVQRAEVESKSQLRHRRGLRTLRCYQMYKELKLKANHNQPKPLGASTCVVIKCTKSWSWKQITTKWHICLVVG